MNDNHSIGVERIALIAVGDVNITFQGNKDGVITPLLGPLPLTKGVPFILPCLELLMVKWPGYHVVCNYYIETDYGTSLEIVTDNNKHVGGQIQYKYV